MIIPEHPGVLLTRTLDNLGMTQAAAARRTGLSTKHMNQVCQGIVGISARSAILLEEITGVDAELWLRLQLRHDLPTARAARGAELAAEQIARHAASVLAADDALRALGEPAPAGDLAARDVHEPDPEPDMALRRGDG